MFSNVVALYRAIGKPPIEGGVISYEGENTSDIIDVVEALNSQGSIPGHFDHYEFHSEHNTVEIEFRLPSSEHGRFYSNVNEFSRNGLLGKGEFPENIYIVELNWADCDISNEEPSSVKELKRVCKLIEYLASLAVGVDRESSPDTYNLFFALPPDDKKLPKTFLIQTQVDERVLGHTLNHMNLLGEILNPKHQNKAHIYERKLMFRMAITSMIEKFESEENHFFVIVREWNKVLAAYRANLQTYVYNFSFEKVRLEVAQAEIDYGSKMSGVLGDIAGKMLALPVSLAGCVALINSNSNLECFFLVVGLIIVSIVLFMTLYNQMFQANRLQHSFDLVFSNFKEKITTYPPNLKNLLKITIKQVEKQGTTLQKTFLLFKILAWLPGAGALFIVFIKYWDNLLKITTNIMSLLC